MRKELSSMSETMNALLKDKASPGFTLKEVPVPRPGPKDLLVRVKRAAICGSDISVITGVHGPRKYFANFR